MLNANEIETRIARIGYRGLKEAPLPQIARTLLRRDIVNPLIVPYCIKTTGGEVRFRLYQGGRRTFTGISLHSVTARTTREVEAAVQAFDIAQEAVLIIPKIEEGSRRQVQYNVHTFHSS